MPSGHLWVQQWPEWSRAGNRTSPLQERKEVWDDHQDSIVVGQEKNTMKIICWI